jgi:hypothetical protein
MLNVPADGRLPRKMTTIENPDRYVDFPGADAHDGQ